MVSVDFGRMPHGIPSVNPDLGLVRESFINDSGKFWDSGGGNHVIDFEGDDISAQIYICANHALDVYIRYEDGKGGEFLSLENRSLLNVTITTICDFQMSAGLFLPREKAWKAIEEFCKTGRRSSEIEWITPDDIPEGGNY